MGFGGGSRDEAPSFSRIMSSSWRTGMVSNWCTYYKDVVIDGCEHISHAPLFDKSMLGDGGLMLIFRVNAKSLGIYTYYRDNDVMNGLDKEPALAGDVKLGVNPA